MRIFRRGQPCFSQGKSLCRDKIIASNQEASVTMHCTPDDAAAVKAFGMYRVGCAMHTLTVGRE